MKTRVSGHWRMEPDGTRRWIRPTTRTVAPRASYRNAVEWIAMNDEPEIFDLDEMAGLISVVLVADLWQKSPETVARAVINYRERHA